VRHQDLPAEPPRRRAGLRRRLRPDAAGVHAGAGGAFGERPPIPDQAGAELRRRRTRPQRAG
jgi:hypothetical protein